MKMSILSSAPSNSEEHARRAPANSGGQSPPQYIAMPPPMFNPSAMSSSSPSRGIDDPFASPLYSPALEMYHTAPSTPITSPLIEVPSLAAAAQRAAEPALANLHISIPTVSSQNTDVDLPVEDAFPTGEIPIDLVDDEGLSALEKIYLFARSQSVFHRVYIVHALPSFLQQVTPQEAIEYVLPLVPCLAMDEDEKVKEALVAELVSVIWWFFTHCQVIPDDLGVEEIVYSSSTSTISVQAFTPILGTLLLSPNSKVGGAARYVVVNILSRIRKLGERESSTPVSSPSTADSDSEEEETVEDIPVGLFGREERLMFEQELLQQVVIGMGRLDVDTEDDVDLYGGHVGQEEPPENTWGRHPGGGAVQVASMEEEATGERVVLSPSEPEKPDDVQPTKSENVNPYFPDLPSYSVPSPGSSNSSTPSSATDSSSSSSSPSVLDNTSTTSAPRPPSSAPTSSSSLRPQQALGNVSPRRMVSPQGSPQTENPSANPTSARQNLLQISGPSSDTGTDDRGMDEADDGDGDQASVGRLSSMSLMAAVTANGCADEDTQNAFVREVERVSHDPVYWVRREASYALGALAKVVPDEVVVCSLIPMFDHLRRDSQWHVRHSALFALPAILSRLSPAHRRTLALDAIIPLSIDDSQPVRSGALESLGEVLFTFHEDDGGPPEELVQLFLGRREDKRVRDGQQAAQDRDQILSSLFGRPVPQHSASRAESPLSSFYTDPARPLICAFNYPAVALTLGRARWGELRQVYLEIADNREVAVRRSLAASLGELAKIIGEENAERDLMGVWWDAVRSEEEEVREKALECVEAFVAALGKEPRIAVVGGLLTIWQEGVFRGWRERKGIAGTLTGLAASVGRDIPAVLRGLLKKALEDGVAAVREAAVSALPRLWGMFADQQAVLADLRDNIRTLSQSELYRQRMTFVACLQALLDGNKLFITSDDDLWSAVSYLADDSVVGVRIGIARLARLASERSQNNHPPVPGFLLDLIRHLCLDSSPDVRSYVRDSLNATPRQSLDASSAEATAVRPRRPKFATFSRPPPPPSPHTMMLEAPLHPEDEDEITRRLTRSTGDINSNLPPVNPVSALTQEPKFTVRENAASKRTVAVSG
ncbi:armadillo-type protein [Mycena alexandri]|uniref:Armadillo-type protein n=1 Tax=Mycena alexandri TaxID=1745969 RepID=A0AAD6XFW8_9AGAR|nr:armadillo-type protein [Mycena alexandri]